MVSSMDKVKNAYKKKESSTKKSKKKKGTSKFKSVISFLKDERLHKSIGLLFIPDLQDGTQTQKHLHSAHISWVLWTPAGWKSKKTQGPKAPATWGLSITLNRNVDKGDKTSQD